METLQDALSAMEHNIAVRLDRIEHRLDSYENMVSCKPFMWAIIELHKNANSSDLIWFDLNLSLTGDCKDSGKPNVEKLNLFLVGQTLARTKED